MSLSKIGALQNRWKGTKDAHYMALEIVPKALGRELREELN
jgi:hypothetical protein